MYVDLPPGGARTIYQLSFVYQDNLRLWERSTAGKQKAQENSKMEDLEIT